MILAEAGLGPMPGLISWVIRTKRYPQLGRWYDEAAAGAPPGVIPVIVRKTERLPWHCTMSLADWLIMLGIERFDHHLVAEGQQPALAEWLERYESLIYPHFNHKKRLFMRKNLAEAAALAGPSQLPVILHRRSEADEPWLATVDKATFLEALTAFAIEKGVDPAWTN